MMSFDEWKRDMELRYDTMPNWYWSADKREDAYRCYLDAMTDYATHIKVLDCRIVPHEKNLIRRLKKALRWIGWGLLIAGAMYSLYLLSEVIIVVIWFLMHGFGN
jgi:hypothetical protein